MMMIIILIYTIRQYITPKLDQRLVFGRSMVIPTWQLHDMMMMTIEYLNYTNVQYQNRHKGHSQLLHIQQAKIAPPEFLIMNQWIYNWPCNNNSRSSSIPNNTQTQKYHRKNTKFKKKIVRKLQIQNNRK